MAENIRKIVRTGVRMEADLHEALTGRLRAIRYHKSEEPIRRKVSIDSEINNAVRAWLRGDVLNDELFAFLNEMASTNGVSLRDLSPEILRNAIVNFSTSPPIQMPIGTDRIRTLDKALEKPLESLRYILQHATEEDRNWIFEVIEHEATLIMRLSASADLGSDVEAEDEDEDEDGDVEEEEVPSRKPRRGPRKR